MLILVAGNVIINISLIKEHYLRQTQKRMKDTSAEIERVYCESQDTVENFIEMIDGTWGIWVRIADENYNLLYTSKTDKNTKSKLSKRTSSVIENGKSALEEQGIFYSQINKDDDNIVRLVCVTNFQDENGIKYIILTRSVQSVYENIGTANRLVEVTALILLIIGFLFIFFFSKSITRPILEISKHAKEISKLNFNNKLSIKSNNEIGALAETINEISDQLSISIDGLRQDINDRKALVRNMSHELKTPISAVKGYAEGLKYAVADTPEKMNKYCDVIIMECNKMDYLVKEMLELSIMERVDWQIRKTDFQAKQLIDGIEMCFSEQIKKRQILFSIEGDVDCRIHGDYHLIERAAFNYIENAIHYTSQYGIIKVNIAECDKGFLFKVYNYGSFIPHEEMKNIWKVFYKTDQSRTRDSNNYGVGLAIVKANIILHGGKVGVENRDDGVEFSFWIPE